MNRVKSILQSKEFERFYVKYTFTLTSLAKILLVGTVAAGIFGVMGQVPGRVLEIAVTSVGGAALLLNIIAGRWEKRKLQFLNISLCSLALIGLGVGGNLNQLSDQAMGIGTLVTGSFTLVTFAIAYIAGKTIFKKKNDRVTQVFG